MAVSPYDQIIRPLESLRNGVRVPPGVGRPGNRTGGVRSAQAPAAPRLEDGRGLGGPEAHLGGRPVVLSRPARAGQDRRDQLLRGAAFLFPHPPAEPAGPARLRPLAAGPPADSRVLLPAPRGDPGQPRPLAPDAPLRS